MGPNERTFKQCACHAAMRLMRECCARQCLERAHHGMCRSASPYISASVARRSVIQQRTHDGSKWLRTGVDGCCVHAHALHFHCKAAAEHEAALLAAHKQQQPWHALRAAQRLRACTRSHAKWMG